MFRILIGKIVHETNTFLPLRTTMQNFRDRLFRTDGTVRELAAADSALRAFADALEQEDVELVPSVLASASPSGIVTKDCFETLLAALLQPLQAEKPDGVLLSLHGAMVTEEDEDGDGCILEAVRKAVGPSVPIMVSLDLHVNLTQKMAENATVLLPCRCYPHTDTYESSVLLAKLMLRTLQGELQPRMVWRQVPILTALTETETEAFAPIEAARRAAEQTPGIVTARVAHGCFYADTADTGASVIAVSDGDALLARQTADRLAEAVWAYRSCFDKAKTYTPAEAIAEAEKSDGLAVFADICDNPGGGSACEGTTLLRAMLEAGVQRAAFGMIADAESVERCYRAGAGNPVQLRLGGKRLPAYSGEPIECSGTVRTLTDGSFVRTGPMAHGVTVCVGRTAAVEIGGVTVIIAERPLQIYDSGIFLKHGLLPEKLHILAVKSALHYRAAFAPMAAGLYPVECPGMIPTDPKTVRYQKLKRKIYPFRNGQ